MTIFDWIRVQENNALLRVDLIEALNAKNGSNGIVQLQCATTSAAYPLVTLLQLSPKDKDAIPRDDESVQNTARDVVKALVKDLSEPASGAIWSWNAAEVKFTKE